MSILKAISKAVTYTDRKGYKRIKGINTKVHRIAATIKIGRPLKPGEVVYQKKAG